MKFSTALALAALVLGVGVMSGCQGEPSMPKEELKTKTDLNGIAQRAFQQGKTWETLDPADKAKYTEYYEDEAKAKEAFQKAFDGMKYFFGGGQNPGGTPPPTGG